MITKKRLRIFAISTGAALLISFSVWAQQVVSGTLRSPSGEPLSGATVVVKGTNRSVVSDAEGRFRIDAPIGSTLTISSVGFQDKDVVVTGATINQTLQTNNTSMNEVVVIGYQSVRRKDLTGSTGIVNMENVNR